MSTGQVGHTSASEAPLQAAHRGRVLVACSEPDEAKTLVALLREFGFASGPSASSMDDTLLEARSAGPDLVLMETQLAGGQDGVHAAERLLQELGLRVVYMSAGFDMSVVERAKQTLPYGFLIKPLRPHDLRSCLELAVHRRRLEQAGTVSEHPARSTLQDLLSAREIEVLELIARGHTSKEVASKLRIAKPTVDTYRARLADKLGIKSRTELMTFAAKVGLLGRLARSKK